MPYCRHCGREIMYTRTANDKWMPYDVTGQPHFCEKDGAKANNGLSVCKTCGKPVFKMRGKVIDYTTLETHRCKKADATRYSKYKQRKKNNREKT